MAAGEGSEELRRCLRRSRLLFRYLGDRRYIFLGHPLRFGKKIHTELIRLLSIRDDLLANVSHARTLGGDIRQEALGVIDLRRRFPLGDAELCILLQIRRLKGDQLFRVGNGNIVELLNGRHKALALLGQGREDIGIHGITFHVNGGERTLAAVQQLRVV